MDHHSLPHPNILAYPPFDRPLYTWSQTPTTITITTLVPVNSTITPVVQVTDTTLVISVPGETRAKVRGKLCRPVKRFESVWQVENVKDPFAVVNSNTSNKDDDGEKKKQSSLVESMVNDFLTSNQQPTTTTTTTPTSEPEKLLTLHLEKQSSELWPVLIVEGLSDPEDLDLTSLYTLALTTSYEIAFPLYETCAKNNYIPAMLKLAAFYELGSEETSGIGANPYTKIPVARDLSISMDWHRQASELGHPEAAYIVGSCFAQGTHDTETDTKRFSKAVEYYVQTINAITPILDNYAGIVASSSSSSSSGSIFLNDTTYINAITSLKNYYIYAAHNAGLLHLSGGNGLGQPNPTLSASYFALAGSKQYPPSLLNLGLLLLEKNVNQGLRLIKVAKRLDDSLEIPTLLREVVGKNNGWEMLERVSAALPEWKLDRVLETVRKGVDEVELVVAKAEAEAAVVAAAVAAEKTVGSGGVSESKKKEKKKDKKTKKKGVKRSRTASSVSETEGGRVSLGTYAGYTVAALAVGIAGMYVMRKLRGI